MRQGAGLYLTDLVFPDEALADWSRYFQQLVESLPADQQANIACHVRAEFSTFDWMMRQILSHAGFTVESAERESMFLTHYLGRKA